MILDTTNGSIELTNLVVKRYVPTSLDLQWVLEASGGAALAEVSVEIWQSHVPSTDLSDYTQLESDYDPNSFSYEDTSISGLPHGTRTWYYKIKVKEVVDTANFIVSDYAYINATEPNAKWRKIHRIKSLGLKTNKAGRDFVLAKKRSWGTRPSEGWDPILFKATGDAPDDENTYGSGWQDAFFSPITVRGMISPNPQAKDVTIWGEFYPSDSVFTTLNRPPLEVGDVLIDPQKDLRYYIQRRRTLEMLGVPIEQQVQISLIHPDDEIYNYDIRED